MKKGKQNIYTSFYKVSALIWVILIAVFFGLKFAESKLGAENLISGFISGLTHVIALFGIFGIPVIVLFSLPVRLFEYAIRRYEEKQSSND